MTFSSRLLLLGLFGGASVIAGPAADTSLLNGQTVNAVTDCSFQEGKILFPAEAAEVFFRKIELHPLQK